MRKIVEQYLSGEISYDIMMCRLPFEAKDFDETMKYLELEHGYVTFEEFVKRL